MNYDKHFIPRVCSESIGAEVKWKVSTNIVITPDYPTPISLEPEAKALDSVPARVLYDRTFIKPLSNKGFIIDMNPFSVKQGSISVLANGQLICQTLARRNVPACVHDQAGKSFCLGGGALV